MKLKEDKTSLTTPQTITSTCVIKQKKTSPVTVTNATEDTTGFFKTWKVYLQPSIGKLRNT